MPRWTARRRRRRPSRHTIAATIRKLESTIPIIQQRVDIRKALMDKELGSKLTYLEILQSLVEQQEDLVIQKSRAAGSGSSVSGNP